MIKKTFRVADRSWEILQCKQKSLISDTEANLKLSAIVDKAVDVDKRWDAAVGRSLNAVAKPSMVIKN